MTDRAVPRIGGIAVIGFACRAPGALNADQFWSNLVDGVESINHFTPQILIESGVDAAQIADPAYVPARGVLSEADCFDAPLFGFTPHEASLMDPQHRIMLECAWEALEHGGYGAPGRGARVAVYAGVALNTYLLRNIFAHQGVLATEGEHQLLVASDKDFVAPRISHQMDFTGPSISVQTACSTSLVAVHMACHALLSHQCDMALAGGAAITVPQEHGYAFREGGILSADGHCRPFDARAAGTVPGNGAGVVVLKRVTDAIEDGDTIHAVIAGSAINNDGANKVGFTAPSISGQTAVISQALALAGVGAGSIGYVEAHGTGTPLGDPIEVAALTAAFRQTTAEQGNCWLGSVKGNLGHLDTAAGIIGLIKTVMAVHSGVVPPSLHFEQANPALDLDTSPFQVPTTTQKWRLPGPRRAGVSSFGIGGTNAHVIVEEAPTPKVPDGVARKAQIFCISARTSDALDRACASLAPAVAASKAPLSNIAFTLASGRRAFAQRRAFVASSAIEATERLKYAGAAVPFVADRPTVWLFPGQGSQYLGMGEALARQEPAFDAALADATAALARAGVPDIRACIWPATHDNDAYECLTRTANAQTAIFAIEYALAELWRSWGMVPGGVLGHSVGEFCAAVIAGVMSLEDAARLVAARGRMMQNMAAGVMLSVSLDERSATDFLRPGIWLSAVNTLDSCVLGGAPQDIAELENELSRRDVETRRLKTSHAFHTGMMEPMLEDFRAEAAKVSLHGPKIPWVSSVSGSWLGADDTTSPDYWVRQIREPVRFAAALTNIIDNGDPAVLEVGPGIALTTLARKSIGSGSVAVSSCGQSTQDEVDATAKALSTVWAAGVEVDWARYYATQALGRVPLPGYQFDRQRYWIDPPSGPSDREPPGSDLAEDTASARMFVPAWDVAPDPVQQEASSRWLLILDQHGIGDALALLLGALGVEVRTLPWLDRVRVDAQTYADILSESRPDHVVHLGSITAGRPVTHEQMLECGYVDVLSLSQALVVHVGDNAEPIKLTVVSDNVHSVTGREGVRAEKSLLLGPVRVLPQEHPEISCRLVDVEMDRPSDIRVHMLLTECLADKQEAVVAHRGRQRWTQSVKAIETPQSPFSGVRPRGVYLITGGLGAVGLSIARHLHKTTSAHIVLTGRRPPPEPEDWPALVEPGDDLATFEIEDLNDADILDLPEHVDPLAIAALDSANQDPETLPLATLSSAAATLDRYCVALLCECLEQAGVDMQPGIRHTFASISSQMGIVHPYSRFLKFMVDLLRDEGVFEGPDEGILVLATTRYDVVDLHEQAVEEHRELEAVFKLLNACALGYTGVLSGSASGIQVLYPDGDSRGVKAAVAAMAHRTSHTGQAELLARLLRRMADSQARPLRILEVGGGNRFLTSILAAALDGTSVEYWFTDIGSSFVGAARTWAKEAGYEHLHFGVLDASRNPEAQGWGDTFDAVVGMDVVHATQNVEVTLRHLHTLTGSGGSVHLIETLPPARWNTMVWGLTKQWWQYNDDIRTTSPLLDGSHWIEALTRAGFQAADTYQSGAQDDCVLLFGLRPASTAKDARLLAIQADVTDPREMAAVVARTRELFGGINGVIHAAGLEASGALSLQHDGAAAPGLAAKVTGTRVLTEALKDEPLDFLMLCSSVTSLLGGVGNVEYTAANAYLDSFAHEQKPLGYPVVSVNWDRWRGLGMAAMVEERHQALLGETLGGGLAETQALNYFDAIVSAPRLPQVIVAPTGFDDAWRDAALVTVKTLATRLVASENHPRPFLATPYVAPANDIERQLASVWQETLGIEAIGADDDFMELGGDSLIAINVVSRLREVLGLRLQVAALFEAPTVAQLAKRVEALRWATAPTSPATENVEEGEL